MNVSQTKPRKGAVERSDEADESSGDVAAGSRTRKVDGRGLVTGDANYTDDVPTPDALAGAVLRSPHAHARVLDVDTEAAEAIEGVRAVLTPDDAPEHRFTREGVARPTGTPYDERVLNEKARFVGDAVCAVAAETPDAAAAALDAIEVEYEVLEAVSDPEAATAPNAPAIHDESNYENARETTDTERNTVGVLEHEVGDVQAGFEEADYVLEETYRTQVVQQAPMEMNTSIAWVDDRDRLALRTSTQIPHVTKNIISEIFDRPQNSVRVIKPRVGGGFGVKQDAVPSQFIACLLALETGEKVRIENAREEDLYVAQTRHAVRATVKTGVTSDGTITANQVDVLSNTGAYACHGISTLSNGGHESLGLYPRTNMKFTGRSVYTNRPVAGAMRGYGTPQVSFAVESHLDAVAEEINVDPVELRRKNHVETGDESFESDRTATPETETIGTCALADCIDVAAEAIGWDDDRDSAESNLHRGVGMALVMHKSGVPNHELAKAEIVLEKDGSFTLRMGVGDAGQGAETAMAQIAASVLNVPTDDINVRTEDTDMTPYDNGAYGSSTTYVSGTAAEEAAHDLREGISAVASRFLDGDPDEFELESGWVTNGSGDSVSIDEVATAAAQGKRGPRTQLVGSGEHYTGRSPKPFAAQAIEVEVDSDTGEFRVARMVSAVDCGVAINPENARGQVVGGAVMGLGQAISEEITFDEDGTPQVEGLKDYGTLRSTDVPDENEAILVESYEPSGPFGAKSVGEVSNIGPLGAVNNAIFDAVGVHLTELPITADGIADALD